MGYLLSPIETIILMVMFIVVVIVMGLIGSIIKRIIEKRDGEKR